MNMARRQQETIGVLTLEGSVEKVGGGIATVLTKDASGNVLTARGTTAPSSFTGAGWAVGAVYTKTNASGSASVFMNTGTTSVAALTPVSSSVPSSYGIIAGKNWATVGSDQTENINVGTVGMLTSDIALAGIQTTNDTDTLLSVITVADGVKVVESVDPSTVHAYDWIALRSNPITRSHQIVAAGRHTTGGGAAAEDITIAGVVATDLVLTTLHTAGTGSRTISKAEAAGGKITVTFSADPVANHVVNYVVLRAANVNPSHRIVDAGLFTTVGGDATESITAIGALSTDGAIGNYSVTDDSDTIITAKAATDAVIVVLSADPGTTHQLAWMLLRAV